MSGWMQNRRHFLQVTGAGLAAVPWVAGCASAQPESIPRKAIGMPWPNWGTLPDTPPPAPKPGSVGVAVVGLGGYAIGKAMPALAAADGTHVAAVVSGNPEKAAKVAAAYGLTEDAIYSYDTFASIAADDRVQAVYIVLPTGLHADWTEYAFAAGKHVICEKPMALSSAECTRMIDAGRAAGKKLMIAYRCHFEPVNLKAMDMVRTGTIGAVQRIETANNYRVGNETPATNWRLARALAGGGPLEDYGLYGLQAALYLSGELPVRLSAETVQPAGDPRFTEVFSTVRAQLYFPSGAVAVIETSYDSDPNNMSNVHGTAGSLLMRPANAYDGNRITLVKGDVSAPVEAGDPEVQFSRMCQHFADAVRKDVAIRTPGAMGLRDLKLIEAIYRSAFLGQTVDL